MYLITQGEEAEARWKSFITVFEIMDVVPEEVFISGEV